MPTFKEMVRQGEVKQPVQLGFKMAAWDKAWSSTKENSPKADEDLYVAGKVFFSILGDIRRELEILHTQKAPMVTNTKFLQLLCALSNRDISIMLNTNIMEAQDNINFFSVTLSNNKYKNEMTIEEISHAAIDGIQKAILFCVTRMQKKQEISQGEVPISILEFIGKEASLSHLYGMYESYWQALLWGDYGFAVNDEENKFCTIMQFDSDSEIAKEISYVRKSRLGAQTSAISMALTEHFDGNSYVVISGSGKDKDFKVKNIESADNYLKGLNAGLQIAALHIEDELPKELLLSKYGNSSYTIYEAIDVLRILVLLAQQSLKKFPVNDEFLNANKLSEFCPKFNKQKLTLAISIATELQFAKVVEIMELLTYSTKEDDLWSQPLIKFDSNHIGFLVGALLSPYLVRVVEHWLSKLKIDLQIKGYSYESVIYDIVNRKAKENIFVEDFDPAQSATINIADDGEQIDFIFRVGKIVLVGEAKSIVATDSSLSYYRVLKNLEGAAVQAKRKADFVGTNIRAVFNRLSWKFDPSLDYKIVPIIINSNRMHVGFSINDIPVCDEKIISAYFESNTFSFLSVLDSLNKPLHLAWFELYDNFDKLQSNLKTYLEKPTQITLDKYDFSYKMTGIPYFDENSYKIRCFTLVQKDLTPKEMLEKNYSFEVKTHPKIDDYLSNMDFCI